MWVLSDGEISDKMLQLILVRKPGNFSPNPTPVLFFVMVWRTGTSKKINVIISFTGHTTCFFIITEPYHPASVVGKMLESMVKKITCALISFCHTCYSNPDAHKNMVLTSHWRMNLSSLYESGQVKFIVIWCGEVYGTMKILPLGRAMGKIHSADYSSQHCIPIPETSLSYTMR